MLAANIGAGSTVGATALGYRDGLAARVVGRVGGGRARSCWRSGSVPRSAASPPSTTSARSATSSSSATAWPCARRSPRCCGSAPLFILAGQLIAIASILNVVVGVPPAVGCAVGGLLITIYFTAGGLLTSAWVNVVQLTVKLVGFAIALPLALAGGRRMGCGARAAARHRTTGISWQGGHSGLIYLAMLGAGLRGLARPAAEDLRRARRPRGAPRRGRQRDRAGAVRDGAGRHGHDRAAAVPDLESPQLALPTLLLHGVPPAVGGIGLAAVFSAELSAADAVLFMLTTSLSQDFYKRFVNRRRSDRAGAARHAHDRCRRRRARRDRGDHRRGCHRCAEHLLHADGRRAVRPDPGGSLHAAPERQPARSPRSSPASSIVGGLQMCHRRAPASRASRRRCSGCSARLAAYERRVGGRSGR